MNLRPKRELELGIERKEEGRGMVSPQNLTPTRRGKEQQENVQE